MAKCWLITWQFVLIDIMNKHYHYSCNENIIEIWFFHLIKKQRQIKENHSIYPFTHLQENVLNKIVVVFLGFFAFEVHA